MNRDNVANRVPWRPNICVVVPNLKDHNAINIYGGMKRPYRSLASVLAESAHIANQVIEKLLRRHNS